MKTKIFLALVASTLMLTSCEGSIVSRFQRVADVICKEDGGFTASWNGGNRNWDCYDRKGSIIKTINHTFVQHISSNNSVYADFVGLTK